MMWSKKLSLLVVLVSITGLVITGLAGSLVMTSNEPDPLSLPLSERWVFNASIDRTAYHPGDDTTLTVELTCLAGYTVNEYHVMKPWMHISWRILDSSNNTVWDPSGQYGALTFVEYEFYEGDELGGTYVLHLGTTEERPASWQNFHHWVPLLAAGEYYFVVGLNPDLKFDADDRSSISIPFAVEGNETVINHH
ncbi:MAG: hypothetical protein ACFFD4_09965 [Candidatus Odinarchaeota archaeon]